MNDVLSTMHNTPNADYRVVGTAQNTVEVFVGDSTLARQVFSNYNQLDNTCTELACIKAQRTQRQRWHDKTARLVNLNDGESV